MSEQLDDRSKMILQALVEDHIDHAEPVGSRAISKRPAIGLSPASIRNVMAELEERGFLISPHTSAGRIPTDKGYRFYVESILQLRDLNAQEKERLQQVCSVRGMPIEEAMRSLGRAISNVSHYTGLVLAPRTESIILKRIDFLRLSENRLLVILVSESGIVQNKIIELAEPVSSAELEHAVAFLNRCYAGLTLAAAKEQLIREMQSEKLRFDRIFAKTLRITSEAFSPRQDAEVFIEGASHIFDQPEFANIERMKRVMRTFEEKSLLLELLDKSQRAEGIKIFIGGEDEKSGIEGCSLITANFSLREGVVGTLGVIGPSRMPYSQVIPMVDYTARLFSQLMLES